MLPHKFPAAWPWLVDEALPTYVKKHYSPRESWKDKPFGQEDASFFFKGIQELSEIFTEDRGKAIATYFNHPKYRSAYLLYFLPLQAAKFSALFELKQPALEAALRHGREKGVLRVLDLGAGPGTASIAFLLWIMGQRLALGETLPLIELEWYDTNATIMADGQAIVETIASHFPKLRGRVSVKTHVAPWWKSASRQDETSLVLVGHVLNEAQPKSGAGSDSDPLTQTIGALHKNARGGGILVVEPAARSTSQLLSQLRDHLFENDWLEKSPSSLWGPCLHAGRCPLADGRDWCHFSVPVEVPGKYFRSFSKSLSSERQWLKFSYLWLASTDQPAPIPAKNLRLVLSDPLTSQKPGTRGGPKESDVLICEPEAVGRHRVSSLHPAWRGDIIKI